jgi:hypothetical protein
MPNQGDDVVLRVREEKRQAEAAGSGAISGEADPERCGGGKLLRPEQRQGAVEHTRRKYGVSERQACRV